MDKKEIDEIMNKLQESPGFFVNEAHFQMSFAKELIQLEKYSIYPEYPVEGMPGEDGKDKRDEIDLCVVDKNNKKKTFIEFKYKTKENKVVINNDEGTPIILKNHLAQNLGRYDCWKDIERLEFHVKKKDADQGFFIFVTNDDAYLTDKKLEKSKFGQAFSIKAGNYEAGKKEWPDKEAWNGDDEKRKKSIGKNRLDPIEIGNDYVIKYSQFNIAKSGNNKEFHQMIVEIKKE